MNYGGIFASSTAERIVKQASLLPPPSAPMAVARAIVKQLYTTTHGLVLRYHRGLPYRWDGTCWPEVAVRDVRSEVYHALEHAHFEHPEKGPVSWEPTKRKLDDVIDALQAIALIESRLDPPAWTTTAPYPASEIVSLQNGLLHVPSRTLLPHTPAFFTQHSLPFAYLERAPAPRRWLQFLRELWPEDTSSIDALQEVMGYLLAGGTSLQKIFMLVGPKRGGKGTIARVLGGLLGVHNVAAPTLASLATNFGLSPLVGKPVAIVADARLSPRAESSIVVERLLSISGEDHLTIDRKYRDAWTGRLPTRFLILTNELPRLTDASGALASRFILLVLHQSFYGKENPRLTDELLAESPAIFTWALTGLDRLVARGHFAQPATSRDAIQQLEDLASPVSAFIRTHCVVGAHEHVLCATLWASWKAWCEDQNRGPGNKATLGQALRAAVPTIKNSRVRYEGDREPTYIGIGLREENNAGPPRTPRTDPMPVRGVRRDRAMYPPQEQDDVESV